MSELTFRQARADEIETVFSLLKSAALWLRDKNIDYWQNWLEPPEAHARWVRRGFENKAFFFVECEGKLIGCFRLQWKDTMFWGDREDNAGYIHSFTTRRELAGTGTGQRVLTLIESHCRERGKQFLRLDCGTGNPSLRMYYESLGFESVGEVTVGGEQLTLYEKPLVDNGLHHDNVNKPPT